MHVLQLTSPFRKNILTQIKIDIDFQVLQSSWLLLCQPQDRHDDLHSPAVVLYGLTHSASQSRAGSRGLKADGWLQLSHRLEVGFLSHVKKS